MTADSSHRREPGENGGGTTLPPAVSAKAGFGAGGLALVGVLFAGVLLARNPSILFRAQFWAEDGWFWYPEAYSSGTVTVFWPLTGYLQTSSRLVALMAQLVPLSWAPVLFAAAALVIQLAPAIFLVSNRMAPVWPSRAARIVFALFYLAAPNTFETYVNLPNAQWHLALLAFLVVMSASPRGWRGRAFDAGALLLSGLSGPFCLMLLPIAVLKLYHANNSGRRWRAGLVFATALIQGGFLVASIGTRSSAPLGADPLLLARIVATQIVSVALIGHDNMKALALEPLWQSPVLPLTIALAAAALATVAMFRGLPLLRHAFLFAGLILGAALLAPQVSLAQPQWPLMATVGSVGNRYFLIPMLVWIGAIVMLVADRFWPLRCIGGVLMLLLLAVGIPTDWRQPELLPSAFQQKALEFATAPPGTRVVFPIRPGDAVMVLVKRGE